MGEADHPGPSRRNSNEYAVIANLNSSGKVQLLAALDEYNKKKKVRVGSGYVELKPTALIVQEHHARADAWVDLVAQSRRKKWHLLGAVADEAKRAEGKAGVGVLARTPTCIGRAGKLQVDLSPPESKGRISAVWLDGLVRGGILIVSVYLYDSEGLSNRNVDLLERAGAAITQHGGPWIIGGDFNMTPAELSGVDNIIRRMRGVIVAPNCPTCRAGSGVGRIIDFFIIDHRLHGSVARRCS